MAIIGKIREKSALIVIIVGLALLAFVLSDWQKISGQTENPYGYGTVYGEKIDPVKYDKAVQLRKQSDQQQYMKSGRQYTTDDEENSANEAFKSEVQRIVLAREIDVLGIDVDEEEFEAYLYGDEKAGFSPLPQLAELSLDSVTGKPSPNLLRKRITEMENSANPYWLEDKKNLREARITDKYFDIVSQGLYVTKLEAEDEYFGKAEVKNISFVVKRFDQIPDSDIKVSDGDLKAFYEKHKEDKKYQVLENARDLRYFDVSIKPSKADTNSINILMDGIKDGFKSSENDSLYVMKNSDVKFYTSSKLATAVPIENEKAQNVQQRYPQYLDTTFKTAVIGQIVGPYNNGTNIVVSKVIGFTPRRLKARHILLSTGKATPGYVPDKKLVAQKQKMADSLLTLINKTNFEEFVKKYSEDPGSTSNGGEYDFIEAQMVPEFGEFCATKPIGTIGIVKTIHGIHIIEVLERDDSKFPVLASVQKFFKPSKETKDFLESDVYDLIENKLEPKISAENSVSKKIALFDTIAKKSGYDVKMLSILENSPEIKGFNTSSAEKDLLNLAFSKDAAVGEITTAPIKDKDRYIIAIVSSIRKKGIPSFEDAEAEMRRDLIKEKKAERIKSEMAKYKDLNSLASGLGLQVMNADVNFSAGQINGVGPEPTVVGSIFSGLKDGQRTTPLVGDIGVYVIRIDKTTQAPAAPNYETERKQILSGLRSNSRNEIYIGLRDKANVIDNRIFLNAGILFERED